MSHGADCQTCGRIASSTSCKCCSDCNISPNPKCSCQTGIEKPRKKKARKK